MFIRVLNVSVIAGLLVWNIGCTFSNKSSTDSSYQPGLELPGDFTKTWTVGSGTASQYTVSSSDITYTASTAELVPLSTDQSNASIGFGGGTIVGNTIWDGTGNGLMMPSTGTPGDIQSPSTPNDNIAPVPASGSFLSRVFAGSALNWTKLTWESGIPAGKPLPDNAATETAYDSDNIDMTGNVLLYHMDETSWNGTADEVKDTSGNNRHGVATATVPASRPVPSLSGRFGGAAQFSRQNGQIIAGPSGSYDLTDQVTIEAWVRPELSLPADDDTWHGIVAKGNDYSTDMTFYLMYHQEAGSGVIFSMIQGGSAQGWDTGHPLDNNEWSHIVVVFDQTIAMGQQRLFIYINGKEQGTTPGGLSGQHMVLQPGNHPIRVGVTDSLAETFKGKIDEVAIYNRALTPAEIATRYRRGSNRLKFQVAGCATAGACDGNQTFLGPDGTSSTYYTEGYNSTTSNITEVNLTGITNNFFQYKVFMENDDGDSTPLLKSVAVTPTVYSIDKPNLVPQSGTTYKTLKSFAATTGGAGTVRFQLTKNGSAYYWNGTQWTAATLSSHTNTAAEINTHISTFPSAVGVGTLNFKAFFDSGNGSAKPTLTSVTVEGER